MYPLKIINIIWILGSQDVKEPGSGFIGSEVVKRLADRFSSFSCIGLLVIMTKSLDSGSALLMGGV
jgi:nucleoside-diphosphate-sugar epimerase